MSSCAMGVIHNVFFPGDHSCCGVHAGSYNCGLALLKVSNKLNKEMVYQDIIFRNDSPVCKICASKEA